MFTLPHFREWAIRLTLDNGEPWEIEDYQAAFLEDYFAGRSYTGEGQREFWWILPEGNAKTTTLAGLGVYIVEHRIRAAVPWAAAARDQALIGFRQAEVFVSGSSRLKEFIVCQEGLRKVKNRRTGGYMQIFASDDKTADGIVPTDAFLDELGRQRNLKLYRTFRGKLSKRNGQMAAISAAGEPGEEFEEARTAIRQGAEVFEQNGSHLRAISGAVCLHEWAVSEKADVEDMDVVKAANPFSGVTVDDLREKFEGPTMTRSHWRRMNCNLATRSDESAITEVEWNAAHVGWEPIPKGQHVDVGFDAGWKMDTTAIVPLWMKSAEERVFGVPTILTPPRDGSSMDPQKVKRALTEVNDRNPIDVLVMDISNANDIAGWAANELGCEVVDRSQTQSFAIMDYEYFMEALRSGWLRQPANPEFTRHVMNALAQTLPSGDARFARPARTRVKSTELQDRRVIDALVAASMVHAFNAAQLNEPKAIPWRGI
jgi:phage terminase large subunit-like protein